MCLFAGLWTAGVQLQTGYTRVIRYGRVIIKHTGILIDNRL